MGKRRGRSNAAPEVEPLDVDGVRTVAVVTVLWAVTFVVLAIFRERLVAQGEGWWLWACLAGIGFGLLALEYTRKRRDAILGAQRRAAAAVVDDVDDVDEGDDEDRRITGPIETAADTGAWPVAGAAPVADPATGPITGPITGPVADPVTGSMTGPVADPATGPITGPVNGPISEPVGETSGSAWSDGATTPGEVTDDQAAGPEATDGGGRRRARRGKGRGKSRGRSGAVGRGDAELGTDPNHADDTGIRPTVDGGTSDRPTVDAPRHQPPGQHVPAEPEFDTDVRAWLDLPPAEPTTSADDTATRPIATGRPSVSGRPPVGRAGRRGAEPFDTGELPPSSARSAPYPGEARRRASATPDAARNEVPPADTGTHDLGRPDSGRTETDPGRADTGRTGRIDDTQNDVPLVADTGAVPSAADRAPWDTGEFAPPGSGNPAACDAGRPAGPPLPRRTPSHSSAASEFFDAIKPPAAPSGGGADAGDPGDSDAPLLDTLGAGSDAAPVDEAEVQGSTGTDGPYRGRRARRRDSF